MNLPLISDEVFSPYWHGGGEAPPAGAFHPGLAVFHLGGLSKAFAMPDLKLGWIALNERAASVYGARLELLNDLYLSANGFTQHAVPEIFRSGAEIQERIRATLAVNRRRLLAAFGGHDAARPRAFAGDGGWQALLHLPDGTSEEETVLALLREGVLVHPGFFYGFSSGSWLVLSCLKEEREFSRGLDRLRAVLI
jgi:DNA-binding transcriptional MocR family regulator